ncbi:MAG TPA: ABC transporter permease [Rhizomicrobium sp.]|jgi:putative ABC transport system permease protein|nr:ABC transporter permease [Rhizomicrobium sp.]
MFHHYLITAIRSVAWQKLYSFINIVGLAVGLACAIFIALYLRDELSYDKWIPDSQNIYRIEETYNFPDGRAEFFPNTPFPASIAMQEQIPGVVEQTHLIPEAMTAQIGDRLFPVSVDAVDPNFFQMIKLPLAKGDPATVLAQPESLVLSQVTARKFFGSADPLGKTVMLSGSHLMTVTGVLRDLPHNTHLVADLVMPNTSEADIFPMEVRRRAWLNVRGWGYVKLSPGVDPGTVLAKLNPILDKDVVSRMPNIKMLGSQILHLHLTPFRDVHLAAEGETEAGNWTRIYGFAAIAGMILLIACFNFMNLATARATLRAREVSLRKTMGATRQQLIVQFLGESVIMALIASVLALALVEIFLPAFDNFLARPIAFHYLGDWPLTLAIAAIAIGAGVFGGIYPALVLSGFRPAAILGASAPGISGSGFLRIALVVLQFAIAIGLGIATIVVYAQIHYARQIDVGFDHHNMMVINGARNITLSSFDSMAHALAADPAIAGVALSDQVPFDGRAIYAPARLPGGTQNFSVRVVQVDPDFLSAYGVKLYAGRNLSRARGEDSFPEIPPKTDGNTLINAAAARQFGYTPAGAIGRSILFGENDAHLTIVGVVGDVNFDGFQKPMQPFVYLYSTDWVPTLSVRIKPGEIPAGLAATDRIWHQFAPTVVIRRHFQDESFDKQFLADEQEGAIFGLFVGIAIFIACLGLFGLAAFIAERRTKEIEIRKVSGAGTRSIVWLLLWQFSIPVLIANVIAWPVAWFYLHHWLEAYAYRISLSPLYFLGAGAVALIIAWATIYAHALLVARANPIHALRYE